MHQTTLRFAPGTWRAIEAEAADADVSTAQFVRDAVLWRIAYEAGRRDERGERALAAAVDRGVAFAEPAQEAALDEVSSATALWAQGMQARKRSQQLRAEVQQRREEMLERFGRDGG